MFKRMSYMRALLVFCAQVLAAQTFDFENSLNGFVPDGLAFANQPVSASRISTDRIAPVTLGGDYWASLNYPMGQNGQYLIATGWNYGDGVTGSLLVGRFIPYPGAPLMFQSCASVAPTIPKVSGSNFNCACRARRRQPF